MNGQKSFRALILAATLVASLVGQRAQAQCCNPDVAPPYNGIISALDLAAVINCIRGLPGALCTPTACPCDVNCDGVVNLIDLSYVDAAFRGFPDPCNTPVGACCRTPSGSIPGGCWVSSTSICGAAPYLGDGTTCDVNVCDCNSNGTPDGEDVANATSADCNGNSNPDECDLGKCCFVTTATATCAGGTNQGSPCTSGAQCPGGGTCTGPGGAIQNCSTSHGILCVQPPINGNYGGPCRKCPMENTKIVVEGDGSVFIHVFGPPVTCEDTGGQQTAGGPCSGPPYTDAWVSTSGATMCHNFGAPATQPIPAGFFCPVSNPTCGSDPYSGSLCLEGVPLGLAQYGNADTLIERSDDPFARCSATSPTSETVDIEIVALNLASTAPITVTFNGGQNPEQWDAAVDLAPGGTLFGTPQSMLTATKTGFNGGTYTSILYVQPRFTFTKVGAPSDVRILDTNLENVPAILLNQSTPLPWVSEIDPETGYQGDACSFFHPGLQNNSAVPAPDCNQNAQMDACDIVQGAPDVNTDGIPDECQSQTPPNIFWDANPLNSARGTRSLSFSTVAVTATGGASSAAIRVRLLDLQSPNPANSPCCPPQNFSTYEAATCSAANENNGCVRWLGPPVTVRESQDNPGQGTYVASRLQCAPYYTDWSTLGPIVLVGAEVMPSSTYELSAYSVFCKGIEGICAMVSAPVQASTRRSGDVATPWNPPSASPQPDPLDVVGSLSKFKSLPGSPSKAVAQIQPNTIELNIDLGALDIVATIDAFRGLAYPYSGPCPCPSLVTCNATACSTTVPCAGGLLCVRTCNGGGNANQPCLADQHCPGGTCPLGGFCRDRCGRCQ